MGPGERIMAEEWRNGSYAEYLKAPLENIFPLREDILINQMGYTIHDLCYTTALTVPAGGLADLDICVSWSLPRQAPLGMPVVNMALAMGARVIAAGGNEAQARNAEEILGTAHGGLLTLQVASEQTHGRSRGPLQEGRT